ncbi:MAG: DUF1638 domain-containing protein [Candidatus Bathyarchaeota archaeon]|nr:DUF1638 domain-containing protein [Candidatus Bathyarchaeota archaeon]
MLLSCGILKREIQKLLTDSTINVKPIFLDAGLHVDYALLEKILTSTLEGYSKKGYNKIVVVYGDLCHPKIKQIIEKYPNAVKVDALNCIDCLLGGHKRLYDLDPHGEHFYLSPGWMPSNLKKNVHFREIFDWNQENIKEMFRDLSGVIVLDSLENPKEFETDIQEFSDNTGLGVKQTKTVGIQGLKDVIVEAIKKLEEK